MQDFPPLSFNVALAEIKRLASELRKWAFNEGNLMILT